MDSTHEERQARIDRLERDLRQLATAAAQDRRAAQRREDPMNPISFAGWLRISGPTFATMVFGFTLLWSSQQTLVDQQLELNRSMGRFEGAIAGLDARIVSLDDRIQSLDTGIQALDGRVQSLDARIESLDVGIVALGAAVERLSERVGSGGTP